MTQPAQQRLFLIVRVNNIVIDPPKLAIAGFLTTVGAFKIGTRLASHLDSNVSSIAATALSGSVGTVLLWDGCVKIYNGRITRGFRDLGMGVCLLVSAGLAARTARF